MVAARTLRGMAADNRRSSPRAPTRINAVVRLIDNGTPHAVVGECKGVVIDAAYGGLKVVIPAQSNEVMKKLETGDYRVVVEAISQTGEKAEIVGHSRWTEARGQNVVLGLRCPTMEPGQVFILAWVHGEQMEKRPSKVWPAITALALVLSVVQTMRLSREETRAELAARTAETAPARGQTAARAPTTADAPAATPPPAGEPLPPDALIIPDADLAPPSDMPLQMIDVVVGDGRVTGSIVRTGPMASAMDVRLAQGNLALDCTIPWRNPRAIAAVPFSCPTSQQVDATQLHLEVVAPHVEIEQPDPNKKKP